MVCVRAIPLSKRNRFEMTTNMRARRIVSVIRDYDLKTITRNFFLENSERKMASPRPKSPKTPVSKNEGESFWDKIGTIGRKKRIKEGKQIEHILL